MDEYLFGLYLAGSLLLTLFAITLSVVLIIQRQRQVKAQHEKLNMELRHKTELLNARIDVQEQSMSLISEELHDNVGQLLALVKININGLRSKPEITETGTLHLINKTKELVTKTINEVRYISHSLNSTLIQEQGLVQILRRDVEFLSDSAALETVLEVTGSPKSLTSEKELLIYRIIQELLQNVLKHAVATHVNISLIYGTDELTIVICDNGKGYDTNSVKTSDSLGLRNIRNRAVLLKALLEVDSSPGYGTKTRLVVPYHVTNGNE